MKPQLFRTFPSYWRRKPSLTELDSTCPVDWLQARRHVHILKVHNAHLFLLCLTVLDTQYDPRLPNESLVDLLARCNMKTINSDVGTGRNAASPTWKEMYAGLDKEFSFRQLESKQVDLWVEAGKHPVGWVDVGGTQVAASADSNVEALIRAIILGSVICDEPLARFRLTNEMLKMLSLTVGCGDP